MSSTQSHSRIKQLQARIKYQRVDVHMYIHMCGGCTYAHAHIYVRWGGVSVYYIILCAAIYESDIFSDKITSHC